MSQEQEIENPASQEIVADQAETLRAAAPGIAPTGIDHNRAAQLVAKFTEIVQQAEAGELTAEVKVPVPDIAPDFEFSFIARRLDISSYLYNGLLPENLARQIMGKKKSKADIKKLEKEAFDEAMAMPADEQAATLAYQRQVAQDVVVSPRLSFSEADQGRDDVLCLFGHRFAGPLIVALYTYGMELSPGVPVRLKDGRVMRYEDLRTFRSSQPASLSGTEYDGEDVSLFGQLIPPGL